MRIEGTSGALRGGDGAADARTTVVVATRDRATSLRRTLALLRELPERPPVVVVDDASEDDTREAAARAGVRVIRLERSAGPAARNVGLRAATSRYVAFSDDDSWWAPGALLRAADILDAHPDIGLVAARILVGSEQRLDETSAAMARSPLPHAEGLPGRAVLGFVACGVVVRRAAFLEVGGFSSLVTTGGEEELLALDLASAGWKLVYVDDVVAHHDPPPRRNAYARRRSIVRSRLQTAFLRRPLAVAAREIASAARLALREPPARLALVDVGQSIPTLVRARRPLSREIERDRRLLDRERA